MKCATPFVLLFLYFSCCQSIPLPSVFYESSPIPSSPWGDQLNPKALEEIKVFEDRLLNDNPNFPWRRQILNVKDFGAISNDGKDDWKGIKKAVDAATILSETMYNDYESQRSSNSSLPDFPFATDDRPVLVELRFESNGVYDLGQGIWLPAALCYYCLFNGQNSTVLSHFEPEFVNEQIIPDESPGVYIHWNTEQLFPCYDNWAPRQKWPKYALGFNLGTFKPATTLTQVIGFNKDGNGKVKSIRVKALPLHFSFGASETVQFQHVDSRGKATHWEAPYSTYNGYPGTVTTNQPETEEGEMEIVSTSERQEDIDYLYNNYQVGQFIGLYRGWVMNLGCGFSVVQGINYMGLVSYIGTGGHQTRGFDMIDVHHDRLVNNMYVTTSKGGGGLLGQVFSGGVHRIFHTSQEDGSDDNLDNLSGVGDVLSVDVERREIQFTTTNGRWTGNAIGCPENGAVYAFGRYPNVYDWMPQRVTVKSCIINDTLNEGLTLKYSTWTFEEDISFVKVDDVGFNIDGNPTLLHIKNYRAGNHMYFVLNIKAQTIIVEESFMYNASLACVDVSSDAAYWHEGNPVHTLIVRNNIFEGCFSAITHITNTKDGIPARSASNVSITGNFIFNNATDTLGDWFGKTPIILYSVSNFDITNNTLSLVPGQRTNVPLLQFCNANNGIVSHNLVVNQTLSPWQIGGYDCNRTTGYCPSYPLDSAILYVTSENFPSPIVGIGNQGCVGSQTFNITYSCNSFTGTSVPGSNSTDTTDGFCPFVIPYSGPTDSGVTVLGSKNVLPTFNSAGYLTPSIFLFSFYLFQLFW